MQTPISQRERWVLFTCVQLALLLTVASWGVYGWQGGLPAAVVGGLLLWRSLETGFVLDDGGLRMRSFVPGRGRSWGWPQIRGLVLDEVVDGPRSGRALQLRVRFVIPGEETWPQLIGCSESAARALGAVFEERGLEVTDRRPAQGDRGQRDRARGDRAQGD